MFETLLPRFGSSAPEDLLLRTGLACSVAFLATVFGTRWLLAFLRRRNVSEHVDKTDSEKLKELHKNKSETPTMGGIAVVGGFAAALLLWADLDNPYILPGLALVIAFASLGFLDDWVKLVKSGRKGLSIRGKMAWQIVIALAAAWTLYTLGHGPDGLVDVRVPLVGAASASLPALAFAALAILVMVSTVNAVNFTDGLDGLASGCAVITCLPLAVCALCASSPGTASAMSIPFVEGAGELAVFAGAMTGAGLGFLWHNCFPARLFMGDTGSLALGGAIGYLALALKLELFLPLLGAVFVAEGLSVVLQVLSFRLTGRRIFLIAPLHHRYQFKGWPETQITIRFWISAAVSAAAGTAALKL